MAVADEIEDRQRPGRELESVDRSGAVSDASLVVGRERCKMTQE